ncbi:rhamnolipids biosynthesis 3-oxoacyl-reductase [Clavulina sp. PMI_390]|nr:rhamnolipids biosynthesis 3-oxoacyl-reductase [Clavulina sp. PMI_390]
MSKSGAGIDTQGLKSSQLFDVSGQVALVTGGSTGIGLMIATTLVANGCRVYISSRKEKVLKQVAEQLNQSGPGECRYFAANLGSRAGCEALADHIKSNEKRLHILVNNSGATWGGDWSDFPETQGWDKIMSLNLKAPFYLTAALTPLLINGTSNASMGRVINITSISSLDPRTEMKGVAGEGMGPWSYPVSKAGLNHLTRIQAVKFAPHHVTVNAILPGFFLSKMTQLGGALFEDSLLTQQPTGRTGQPSDVGGVVLFLASQAASHVTGALIPLDGGSMISGFTGFGVSLDTESKTPPKAKL